jgi:hypothetical protein
MCFRWRLFLVGTRVAERPQVSTTTGIGWTLSDPLGRAEIEL